MSEHERRPDPEERDDDQGLTPTNAPRDAEPTPAARADDDPRDEPTPAAHADDDPRDEPAPAARADDDPRDEPAPRAVDLDAETDDAPLAEQASSTDEPVEEAEEAAPGRARPPLIVIIGSALMLVAIGVGLGVALPPPAPAATPQPLSASAPAGAVAPELPTALPLPAAIGEATSTEPIARVGETTITRGDFVRLYQPGGNPSELVNQLIQIELVLQAATNEGVAVDEAAVTTQLAEIRASQGGDEAAFATFLQDQKIGSEENLRQLLRRDQIISEMILRHTTAEQARARHILLSAEGDQIAARKTEAEDLLKQLEDGADFAALASEKSEDPGSKDQGGDLGWAPRGLFVPAFDEAMFSMEQGEIRLVQSDFGWHIIELLDLPEVRGFASREILNTPPGQQAFQETFLPWVEQLKTEAEAANQIEVLVTDDQLVETPAQAP